MIDERTPAGRAEDQLGDGNSESSTPKDTLGVPKETGEPKVHNPRELDEARYAALDCRAHSDQAAALVAAVTGMVAARWPRAWLGGIDVPRKPSDAPNDASANA